MKRDAMYYAREDLAFNAWLKARRGRIASLVEGAPISAFDELARTAFISGVRFGSEEAEIQQAVSHITTAGQDQEGNSVEH